MRLAKILFQPKNNWISEKNIFETNTCNNTWDCFCQRQRKILEQTLIGSPFRCLRLHFSILQPSNNSEEGENKNPIMHADADAPLAQNE